MNPGSLTTESRSSQAPWGHIQSKPKPNPGAHFQKTKAPCPDLFFVCFCFRFLSLEGHREAASTALAFRITRGLQQHQLARMKCHARDPGASE